MKQAVAELGRTRIPSCQLGQCSDQVEPDRVGMVLVIKRNFSKVYVKYLQVVGGIYGSKSRFKVLHAEERTDGRVGENNATGGPNSSAELT